uniref:Uncharacterized protein n=1 Tax=uncultured marine virus TaxID=186617 RepID=A0A0F7L221_9VIRU|nr:hypothetical protein [uncultured marine virus]
MPWFCNRAFSARSSRSSLSCGDSAPSSVPPFPPNCSSNTAVASGLSMNALSASPRRGSSPTNCSRPRTAFMVSSSPASNPNCIRRSASAPSISTCLPSFNVTMRLSGALACASSAPAPCSWVSAPP